ncbi:hypothetical protein C5167_042690 [Papaver somniferum]|uniref:Uncharacterized protein n=1 Tax=Papaver somniferum TaxID=3469 RepID=A0A4Y7L3H9_PAPSO|nr:hypothetical protein C5167_042690 [Papaver somniferum]
MAGTELVLPEKKNPSLTLMDWVQFLVSAVIGLISGRHGSILEFDHKN